MRLTEGRIVHFYRNGLDGKLEGPWPAIVVKVFSDTCASMTAFKEDGMQEFGSSVVHKDHAHGASSYWVWPPREG